jgi:hypothetical protein
MRWGREGHASPVLPAARDDDRRVGPPRVAHAATRRGVRRAPPRTSGRFAATRDCARLGVDSAQQIIAEVGLTATTFPTAKHLASWGGACPGHDESAGINGSHRAPSGNRQMRRLLNRAALAAVKTKGSIFELRYSPNGVRDCRSKIEI